MVEQWQAEPISATEVDRLQNLYGPLAAAVRDLIDATVRTDADEQCVDRAVAGIRAVIEGLRPLPEGGRKALRHAGTGLPLLFTNPVVGHRNPIAPPMVVHHDPEGRCWSELTLGAPYEGPPGMVHGGISALVLDHLLGEAATGGLARPAFTGTITLRYLRGTPLGVLHAEAGIVAVEGHKTFARGFIGDAQGPTVEAEGVFITPAWARDGQ